MQLVELGQVNAEVGQRQIGDGNAAGQVFQVDDAVLHLQQLVAAVFQIVHLVAGLLLDDVLFAGGGNVQQHHAAADALLQVDVFLKLHVGPEVHQLNAVVARADAINPPEPLDDANRVPVNVVIDQPVAVLKVLPFADAVGGDQQVQLALNRKFFGALFGTRRERCQDAAEVAAQGQGRLIAARARDQGALNAQIGLGPAR